MTCCSPPIRRQIPPKPAESGGGMSLERSCEFLRSGRIPRGQRPFPTGEEGIPTFNRSRNGMCRWNFLPGRSRKGNGKLSVCDVEKIPTGENNRNEKRFSGVARAFRFPLSWQGRGLYRYCLHVESHRAEKRSIQRMPYASFFCLPERGWVGSVLRSAGDYLFSSFSFFVNWLFL